MFRVEELQFSKDHIWLKKIDSNSYYLGITDFAQDLLGDIIFTDLPTNKEVAFGEPLGIIESVKTSSDIISPTSAMVVEINPILKNNLNQINDKPYETWICKITTKQGKDISNLLDHNRYKELIKNEN
jgi:glycine cleavage system H protein